MNERIRELRKLLKLTQQEFAEKIGITRNTLASYETGKSNPGDAAVSLICSKLGVNETWLRTGEGEMFLSKSNEDLLMGFAESLTKIDDSDFKKKLVTAIAKMDDETWAAFKKLAYAFLEEFRDSPSEK